MKIVIIIIVKKIKIKIKGIPTTTTKKEGGGREAQEEGDICILMTDSPCCMAETNTTL